ncbi:hypothetical protein XU18_2683 [Perkinsela sp. CCAP 1560/4]|nr:hypothetical protein XU18_2683 [Perkinsela sp. CCAP 1560/4]|eukprot:KNH06479.1 hypothetical protein XU18_2683 [Perkinsela sp. CCAP 1560/4]
MKVKNVMSKKDSKPKPNYKELSENFSISDEVSQREAIAIPKGRIAYANKYGISIDFEGGLKGYLRRINMISSTISVKKMLDTLHLFLESLTEHHVVDMPLRFPVVPIRVCANCKTMELSCKYHDVATYNHHTMNSQNNESEISSIMEDIEANYPFLLCSGCNVALEAEPVSINRDPMRDLWTKHTVYATDELQIISSSESGKYFYNQRVWAYLLLCMKKIVDPNSINNYPSESRKTLKLIEGLTDAFDLLGRVIRGCTVRKFSEGESGEIYLSLDCPGNLRAQAICKSFSEKGESHNKISHAYEKGSLVDGLILDVSWETGELYLLVDPAAVRSAPSSENDFLQCNTVIQKRIKQVSRKNSPTFPGKIIGVEKNYVIALLEVTEAQSVEHLKRSRRKSPKATQKSDESDKGNFHVVVYVWYFNSKLFDIPWRTAGKEKTRLRESGERDPWIFPTIGEDIKVCITNLWSHETPFYIGAFVTNEKHVAKQETVVELPHLDDIFTDPVAPQNKASLEEKGSDAGPKSAVESTVAEKPKKISRKTKEYVIDAIERSRRPIGFMQKLPETKVEYEKALLSSPQSSYVWIQYIAFVLGGGQNGVQEGSQPLTPSILESARRLCERALSMVNAESTEERWNVWVAYLTIEIKHGTSESINTLFSKFIRESDDEAKSYLAVLSLYEEQINQALVLREAQAASSVDLTTCKELAIELISRMVLRCRTDLDVWVRIGKFVISACIRGDGECVQLLKSNILRPKKNAGDGIAALITAFRSLMTSALQDKHGESIVKAMLPVCSFLYRSLEKGPLGGYQSVLSTARAQFEYLLSYNPKKITLIYGVYLDQEIRVLRSLREHLAIDDSKSGECVKDVQTQYHFIQTLFRRVTSLPIKPRRMEGFFRRFSRFETEFGDESSLALVKGYAEEYVSRQQSKDNTVN